MTRPPLLILVSGATATVRKFPEVGVLLVPKAGQYNVGCGRPWAADNGAFSGFVPELFRRMLDRLDAQKKWAGCLFVTAPDWLEVLPTGGVRGDAVKTQAMFTEWWPELSRYRVPIAFVLQDGQTPSTVPWDKCQAVFVGGSTEFKMSRDLATLVGVAKAKGKWVDMGRVNTPGRMRWAWNIGVDSIDGTSFSKWPDVFIGPGVETVAAIRAQGRLF